MCNTVQYVFLFEALLKWTNLMPALLVGIDTLPAHPFIYCLSWISEPSEQIILSLRLNPASSVWTCWDSRTVDKGSVNELRNVSNCDENIPGPLIIRSHFRTMMPSMVTFKQGMSCYKCVINLRKHVQPFTTEHSLTAVSYTHLTLPTILRV